jgi:hypothetical protein
MCEWSCGAPFFLPSLACVAGADVNKGRRGHHGSRTWETVCIPRIVMRDTSTQQTITKSQMPCAAVFAACSPCASTTRPGRRAKSFRRQHRHLLSRATGRPKPPSVRRYVCRAPRTGAQVIQRSKGISTGADLFRCLKQFNFICMDQTVDTKTRHVRLGGEVNLTG